MFSEISEIKSIRDQKSKLSERERELTAPILSDLSKINTIYEWFKEIISNRDCPPNPESVTQRKKFIFIILFLFSPSTLAGGKMADGLRIKLSEVLSLNAASTISNNISDVVFYYNQYREFRADVDWIYLEIQNRLESGL